MLDAFKRNDLAYAPPPDVVPNTRQALQVTELARDLGLQRVFHDRLMDAYWAEEANIGDPDVLRRLAGEVGLDLEQVDDVLAGDRYVDRIASSTHQAHSIGITGIPGFLLDRRLVLTGAHPLDVFDQAFAQLGLEPVDEDAGANGQGLGEDKADPDAPAV
jgi:predicted DsbA family dithiol-disulfide isomerase